MAHCNEPKRFLRRSHKLGEWTSSEEQPVLRKHQFDRPRRRPCPPAGRRLRTDGIRRQQQRSVYDDIRLVAEPLQRECGTTSTRVRSGREPAPRRSAVMAKPGTIRVHPAPHHRVGETSQILQAMVVPGGRHSPRANGLLAVPEGHDENQATPGTGSRLRSFSRRFGSTCGSRSASATSKTWSPSVGSWSPTRRSGGACLRERAMEEQSSRKFTSADPAARS
jgi:hypothetical protein